MTIQEALIAKAEKSQMTGDASQMSDVIDELIDYIYANVQDD